MRKVTETCVHPHLPVGLELRGPEADPSFERPDVAEPGCAAVPVVAMLVGEGAAMPGPLHEATGFVGHGVVRCIGERPHGLVGHIGPVGVRVVLRAGCTVLQVVASTHLVHPRALHEGRDGGDVILPESLPAMPVRVEREEACGFADERERRRHFAGIQRKRVRRAPVQVVPAIVVLEQPGIPRARWQLACGQRARPAWLEGVRRHRCLAIEPNQRATFRIRDVVDRSRARLRGHEDQAVAIGERGRCDNAFMGPQARCDEAPAEQVVG